MQETMNPYISTMNYRHPFHNAPDPYLFFPSKEHQAALNLLLKFLRAKKGLFLLMGKIGTGKTTLCRYIQANYAQEFVIGLIGNPFLTPKQFEQKVLQEFNLTASSNNDFLSLLHNTLLKLHNDQKNPVLFLDEGHLLSPELFEFILILSNLQADNVHLLQIVIGRPTRVGKHSQATSFCFPVSTHWWTDIFIRFKCQGYSKLHPISAD
jgi:type II secretory pathway predicted ATPase ExeA